jgi:uncharacterized protein (TIGR00645 family)
LSLSGTGKKGGRNHNRNDRATGSRAGEPSIVAISAIHVLQAFLNIDAAFDATRMTWLVGVHLVFVISALLLALSDHLTAEKANGE